MNRFQKTTQFSDLRSRNYYCLYFIVSWKSLKKWKVQVNWHTSLLLWKTKISKTQLVKQTVQPFFFISLGTLHSGPTHKSWKAWIIELLLKIVLEDKNQEYIQIPPNWSSIVVMVFIIPPPQCYYMIQNGINVVPIRKHESWGVDAKIVHVSSASPFKGVSCTRQPTRPLPFLGEGAETQL